MKKQSISFESDLTGLDQNDWSDRILEIGAALGTSESLGDDHLAVFLEAGPNLIVTFEDGTKLRRKAKGAEPTGFSFTRRDGWSTLSILAKASSWFRDKAIFEYIDRLTDEGFFDNFDNVLFYGEHAGGYAACAYSVAAPGSTVLALSPFATLTPSIASFDPRTNKTKKVDFTSRYGYAPSMLDAAKSAFIVYSPRRRIEAIHASLFIRDNVALLAAHGHLRPLETKFEELDILEDLIQAAMAGSLTRTIFADQYRARRESRDFLVDLINRAIESGHPKLAAAACATALKVVQDPELEELQKSLVEQTQTENLATAAAN